MSLYTTQQLKEKIVLSPNQIRNITDDNDLKNLLENLLKRKISNRCIKQGYVDGNSIEIISRTIGLINSSHLNGSISYNIIYKANICNPKKGQILNAEVSEYNNMGILAKISTILVIVIPKHLHKNKEIFKDFKDLENNKYTIKIEVVGKRFDLNKKSIFVIAKLLDIVNIDKIN